jgi:hypothetical protein
MFQTKVVEKIKTQFIFDKFFSENRTVCEIRWKNIVEPDKPQMKIWRMRFACWIAKATNTHSEYVILFPFTRHQWLRERVLLLRYTCIDCLVRKFLLHCCGTEVWLEGINPLTPNDLYRRHAVSPLKIKIPSKSMREKPTNTPIIHSVY